MPDCIDGLINTYITYTHINLFSTVTPYWAILQCIDVVGWMTGRASGL